MIKRRLSKYRIITNEKVGKTIKRKTMQRVQYLSSVGEIGWGRPDLPWAMRLHFSLKQTLGKKKNTIIPQTNTQYKRNTLFPQTKTHLPHKKRSQRQTLLTNKQSQRKKHVSPTNKTSGRKKTLLLYQRLEIGDISLK